MTDVATMQRSYRRFLRCYPTSYRREHEAEILAVLIAAADDGQQRADWRECLALIRGALGIRLRPRIARSDRSMFAAVRLMYLGAAVELLVAITVAASMTNLRSRLVAKDPGLTSSQWHAEVAGSLRPLVISAVIATGFWLWMAWANGHRQRWAPVMFVVFFGLTTFSLANGLAHGSAIYAPTDLAVGTLLWLIQLSVVGLLFHRRPVVHHPTS